MKKPLALLLSAALCAGLFAGCTGTQGGAGTPAPQTPVSYTHLTLPTN